MKLLMTSLSKEGVDPCLIGTHAAEEANSVPNLNENRVTPGSFSEIEHGHG
jgi:hypothetical protein